MEGVALHTTPHNEGWFGCGCAAGATRAGLAWFVEGVALHTSPHNEGWFGCGCAAGATRAGLPFFVEGVALGQAHPARWALVL